ncbi:MAG: hypothetical protein K2X82_17205 [Gemmataceae bacterium]|nr:hypothetical protein [Gemmataceae bacterium]
MRTGNLAVGVAAVVVVSGLAFAFVRQGSAEADSRSSPAGMSGAAAAEVDDLATNPDGFKGEVRLRAAVAKVNKAKGVFAAIDAREFESCGCIDCAKHYLPVRYAGELPTVKSVVELTGEVVRTDKGLVFEAKRLEAK